MFSTSRIARSRSSSGYFRAAPISPLSRGLGVSTKPGAIHTGTRCPAASPAATACTTIPRTAASTTLIRPRTPRRRAARTRKHQPARPRPGTRCLQSRVRQPRHEQPELPGPRLPAAPRPGAPAQEQRDRARIAPGRRLSPVAAETHLPQETVGHRNDPDTSLQHRPVPHPGRQPHQESPHPRSPRHAQSTEYYQPRAPHPRRPAAELVTRLVQATSHNRPTDPWRRVASSTRAWTRCAASM